MLQSSALTAASQPTTYQPTHVFANGVPAGPNDVPLKFRQLESGTGVLGGGLGAPLAARPLPMFLDGETQNETVITNNYYAQFPPRNCFEAIARWMCPGRTNLAASTVSVEASGIGCFCCPGYRFCKCCDPTYPTNAVPITVANPMNIEDVQQGVEISETRAMLPQQMAVMADQAILNTTRAIMPPLGVSMMAPGMIMTNVVSPSMAAVANGLRGTMMGGGMPLGGGIPIPPMPIGGMGLPPSGMMGPASGMMGMALNQSLVGRFGP